MELQKPLRLITPTLDGEVFKVLARVDASFSASEIHRLLGKYSDEGIRKTLNRLVVQGIVSAQIFGRTNVYSLNREHLAAPYIQRLVDLREEFLGRVCVQIESWMPAPIYVALFGSAVRDEMHPNSDIDIFIVRPDGIELDDSAWEGQLGKLSSDVTKWTGNDTRLLEMSESEVFEGLLANNAVLVDIGNEGVHIFGPLRFLHKSRVVRQEHALRSQRSGE